jgi:AcrR family transcriptional regulator
LPLVTHTASDVKPVYMSWSGQGGFERRGYHHGNLREALVEAAQTLIAGKGPAGFTIAEAARLAGVSPAAPYRHFRDAEALLAEVALRGFQRFAVVLTEAWNDGRPDPLRAFEAVGRAYLGFARNEPAFYAAMFEARFDFAGYPGLLAAGDATFAILRQGAERLTTGLPNRPPSLMIALHVWALSHGIASLFCRADASRRKLPMSPEDLLEAGVLLYLQSLGLAGGPQSGATR